MKKKTKFNIKSIGKKEIAILGLAVVFLVGAVFVTVNKDVMAQITGSGLSISLTVQEVKELACTFFDRCEPREELSLGAFPGPELTTDFLIIGGVEHYYRNSRMNVGTSTVCSLRAPTSASTTLVYAAVSFNFSSTSAGSIELGEDVNNNTGTTTSSYGFFALDASSKQIFYASTTLTAGVDDTLGYDPSAFFNAKVSIPLSAGYENYAPDGTCNAIFIGR